MPQQHYARRSILRAGLATTVGVVGATTQSCGRPSSPTGTHARTPDSEPMGASPPPGGRWHPRFVDNFGSIDTTLWYRYDSDYGASLQTEHWLRPRNLHADGTLKVISKREHYHGKDFTSGFLSTGQRGGHGEPAPRGDTFFPRAGFYEVSGKVNQAQGLLPACWLRHRNGAGVAEVDIMEVFHAQHPGTTQQTLHLDGEHNVYKVSTPIEAPDAEPQWHVWGVAILPEERGVRFRFYTDGTEVGEYLATDPAFWNDYDQHNLWDISIDTYVGGVWVGHPDDPLGYSRYNGGFCLSSGTPPDCDTTNLRAPEFPTVLEIDYVAVWELRRDDDDD